MNTNESHRAAISARLLDVSKHYGRPGSSEVVALSHVALDVERGEFTAVMGPSGSGKSTLMHCLAGLDRPTSGRVVIAERDITDLGDTELTILRRRDIGFIFQAFNLIPTLTAAENIELPFRLDGRRPDGEERAWITHLTQVLGLSDRLGHRPNELSGGQQQRVAIARALATRPQLVIADEPTGNLDSRTATEVQHLLRAAATDFGQTIVMVTHDPIAASIADRIVFLADGRIVRQERGLDPAAVSRIMIDDLVPQQPTEARA
ncbi:ABC transporter ATP-binding protein [Pseudoclavibacter chungangensis]|uniref:ABC transporter ATP-binding protein n=1 Tax=Pseudoclavibacter chungangensis TaxID=587635 RepID=A0A7J5BRA4_9MICO|nr:ABC transporter ATP-binding protein [Pseudoclavibacter chungangensis]KAB1656838.1 ABC transporter ATP-binding protein [Pseudoclavibacter chungangensis]NYJ67298.1 putative ABC transport system ATP-binding protein [Pseudoclavibacter chungangensis]